MHRGQAAALLRTLVFFFHPLCRTSTSPTWQSTVSGEKNHRLFTLLLMSGRGTGGGGLGRSTRHAGDSSRIRQRPRLMQLDTVAGVGADPNAGSTPPVRTCSTAQYRVESSVKPSKVRTWWLADGETCDLLAEVATPTTRACSTCAPGDAQ